MLISRNASPAPAPPWRGSMARLRHPQCRRPGQGTALRPHAGRQPPAGEQGEHAEAAGHGADAGTALR